MLEIQASTLEGVTYYQATARGVLYTLHYSKVIGEWELHSSRLALGRMNVGGVRFFPDLKRLEEKLKCFAGISLMIGADQPPAQAV